MKLIELNMDKIIALCKKYKVAKLLVFGSILTPRFNADSEVICMECLIAQKSY